MSEQLPSERCPRCDSERRPTPRDCGFGLLREYRCVDCGAVWSVEGRQETLFDLEGQVTLAID